MTEWLPLIDRVGLWLVVLVVIIGEQATATAAQPSTIVGVIVRLVARLATIGAIVLAARWLL
jgi:hypothetical protein